MVTVDKLYDCFTDAELDRLVQIKSDPNWVPNTQVARVSPLHSEDYVQIGVHIRAHLHKRLKERCDSLGISIREYLNAVLEVMLT